jgi:hypothetical protein
VSRFSNIFNFSHCKLSNQLFIPLVFVLHPSHHPYQLACPPKNVLGTLVFTPIQIS